jgi:hypothetical protein
VSILGRTLSILVIGTLFAIGSPFQRKTEVDIPDNKVERCVILLEMCEAPTVMLKVGGPKVRRTSEIIPLLLEVADHDLSTIRQSVAIYQAHADKASFDWMARRDVLDILAKIVWALPSKAKGWADGGPMAPLAVKHRKLVITRLFPASRTGVWLSYEQYEQAYGKGKRRDLKPFASQRIPKAKLDAEMRDAMRDIPVVNGHWVLG